MLKLTSRREVAERTVAFEFDKPAGFAFKAGQFAEIAWVDPQETDAEGNSRAFSIASAPHEERLMFTTRLRDTAFKRILQKTPIGTLVKLEGPFGDLTLHNNVSRPAILLAGGIGITPFRSIVRRAAHEKLPHRIFLFYANRRPEDAPFLEELSALERENANFTFVPAMTASSVRPGVDRRNRPLHPRNARAPHEEDWRRGGPTPPAPSITLPGHPHW